MHSLSPGVALFIFFAVLCLWIDLVCVCVAWQPAAISGGCLTPYVVCGCLGSGIAAFACWGIAVLG